jgi:hypothetical protein
MAESKNAYINYITYLYKNNNSLSLAEIYLHNKIKAFILHAENKVKEICKFKLEDDELLDTIKLYIITFYAYYNRLLQFKVNEDRVLKYVNNFRQFYSNIPENITDKISLYFLTKEINRYTPILENFKEKILFNIKFADYYNMIKTASKSR